jgi:hypothetical protein
LPRTELNITPKSLAVIYTAAWQKTRYRYSVLMIEIEDWAANNMNWMTFGTLQDAYQPAMMLISRGMG